MTILNQIYKCNVCGNMVEVIYSGLGKLVCCGQPMELQKENSTKASIEKHKPIISKEGGICRVDIGSIPHPMEDDHFIEWIEVLTDKKVYRQYLQLKDKPAAEFKIDEEPISARSYCNLHGLWN